jgi:hypothetical protein
MNRGSKLQGIRVRGDDELIDMSARSDQLWKVERPSAGYSNNNWNFSHTCMEFSGVPFFVELCRVNYSDYAKVLHHLKTFKDGFVLRAV